MKYRPGRQHLRWKKDIELEEYGRFVLGSADVDQPTQDAQCVSYVSTGPIYAWWPHALKRVMTQSATTIYNESLAARSTQIGATNTAPPYLENHQAPVAIRSHYEYFEVCNMNKGVMVLEISCWRWRPGRDYQGGSLENEVILSKDEGTGKILYSKADPPLGYVSWKGVSVPEQRHEYPVGVTGTVTGFGVESFFPARRGIFDTQFCKRIWKRTVHLPPSSSYKFKVFIPRIWPVFEEDVTALQYLMKNKIERVLRFRWHSLCGLVPVADETKDPVASDIHTEKMILAMRKCTKVSAVRYLEPPLQIRVDDSLNFNNLVPIRGPTNRATTFKVHKDAEKVAGVPGQAQA